MVQKDNEPLESRPPILADLLELCRNLNEEGVKYIVVGGMAIIQHGYVRATEDIDLLVDASIENVNKLKESLLFLPDKAIEELRERDIEEYSVVRVADEIIIDLMKSACGITYNEAKDSIVKVEIKGVLIPFASIELLWKMKQADREKDKLDRLFLSEKMKQSK